jgi:hypothetical protein
MEAQRQGEERVVTLRIILICPSNYTKQIGPCLYDEGVSHEELYCSVGQVSRSEAGMNQGMHPGTLTAWNSLGKNRLIPI